MRGEVQGAGLSTQGYYKWLKDPISQGDWDDAHVIDALLGIHEDDPTLGYRFLTDELADVGISASENGVWRLCLTAGFFASHARMKRKAGKPGARARRRPARRRRRQGPRHP